MPVSRPYLALLLAAATAVTGCNGGTSTSAGLASPASPTATSPGTGEATPAPSDQDRIWLREIHQGNLAEIQAGDLAEGKGTAPEVKQFGAMLVKDHTKLDQEVVRTAEQLDVKLPKAASSAQKEVLAELREASRADFDEEFVTAMRKAHEKAVAATKTEIEQGTSPQVKQLAEQALPALERHLDELEKIPGAGTPAPDSGTPAPGNS
ncbi:DUF4142 domain-containing protein [Nonomuraea sp. NPDC048826]|uniref:DUF4142 domain-containing protein n=1 Tax=Nonomuraea sp. NPDC048826 TaxID=3364347 RepID=UPI003712CB1A